MIIIISLAKSSFKNENVILTLSTSEYANKKQQLKHTGKQVVSVPTTGVTASPALSVGPRRTFAHLVVGCFRVMFPLSTDLRSAFPPPILTISGETKPRSASRGNVTLLMVGSTLLSGFPMYPFLCIQSTRHRSLRNGIVISDIVAMPISSLQYCFHMSSDFAQ